ncbi:MAG TPA: SDR family oxidoreductase [Steroidobacteraceae bacterium]|nr:SDR family oxidoreductase [Steroidobacteraceae bacterium]
MSWPNIRFDFSGATVLITGGTGGLGLAIAKAFREAAAEVTVTGTRASAAAYDENLRAYRYLQLDMEDRDQVDLVNTQFDRLDIVINCAGVAMFALGLDEADPDVFERALSMHLSGVQRLSTRIAPLLSRSKLPGRASIVNMASMSSFFGIQLLPAYGAAKTGLLGLTRALAVRWGSQNIRVNAIAAGLTRSRMTSPLLADAGINASMLSRVPLGRHGEPEDIAGATLFLCSAAASWITGQTVCVDGGFTIAG